MGSWLHSTRHAVFLIHKKRDWLPALKCHVAALVPFRNVVCGRQKMSPSRHTSLLTSFFSPSRPRSLLSFFPLTDTAVSRRRRRHSSQPAPHLPRSSFTITEKLIYFPPRAYTLSARTLRQHWGSVDRLQIKAKWTGEARLLQPFYEWYGAFYLSYKNTHNQETYI